MSSLSSPTPREFGEALKRAREDAGVPLEAIVERTKISRRVLEDLEAGEYARLPNRVFVQLFLQQYLKILKEDPERWVKAFAIAWQRFESASQPFPTIVDTPSRARRAAPWLVGLAVVVIGLIAVVALERRHNGERAVPARPTPDVLLPIVAATPTALPTPTATAAATPEPGQLVVRAVARPCWVAVQVKGERAAARLLAPGAAWEVAAGGRELVLVLGDAGAAEVSYLGETRAPAGTAGEVLRVRLGPAGTRPGSPQ